MASRRLLASLALTALIGCAAAPGETAAQDVAAGTATPRRQIVAISDLHFGLGHVAKDKWDPREDFRWTNALREFLEATRKSGADKVDLVIAGDFLELWQPPDDVRCDGDADAACSVAEMRAVVRHVVGQHATDLKLLGDFAKQGDNRLIVIPGNHDAALLVPEIWAEVSTALGAESGRVAFISDGVWASIDGQVVIEHGHQIGADVNSFAKWPTVTRQREGDAVVFLHSPWGERFVQKLFNAEERTYPIIDNLSPESYGARLRLADRGLWRSAADVARFLAFNLFETTVTQKAQSLGTEGKAGEPCTRREAEALGYRMFASALPADDPFRGELEGTSEEAKALQTQLNELAKTLSLEELAQICRQRNSTQDLGGLIESTFVARQDVLRKHADARLAKFPNMKLFVYAHTHQLERPWNLRLGLGSSVTVLNTGAFQRLVDEAGFKQRLKDRKIKKPSDGLSKIALEALAPCYSFVEIQAGSSIALPVAATKMWKMDEGESSGDVKAAGTKECQ